MRGGWRYRAGRPGWRPKAEHCLAIDVRRWAREGMLSAGYHGWAWRDAATGDETASIGVLTHGPEGLTLTYSANGALVRDLVPLRRTPCPFGGSRPWFVCPRCNRNAAKLFMRSGRYACRPCQRIAYRSQSTDLVGRLWARQMKLESKLGEHYSRPKGMHRSTYDRLIEEICDCDVRREEAFGAHIADLMRRYPALAREPLLAGVGQAKAVRG